MDYTRQLSEAIAAAKAAGLEAEAAELETTCFRVAYTTSSEMLGEHGLALRRFLEATRGRLPASVRDILQPCLVEAGIAWPGWRSLLSRLKGP